MAATLTQRDTSAGGVAFRQVDDRNEVVLISVGEPARWQLPKGMINPGETPEQAAQREVHEEGGVDTELISSLDTIEYYFFSGRDRSRTRHHKYVYFFLLRYCSGDPSLHDHEVNEARWFEIHRAVEQLTFESERRVLRLAIERLSSRPPAE